MDFFARIVVRKVKFALPFIIRKNANPKLKMSGSPVPLKPIDERIFDNRRSEQMGVPTDGAGGWRMKIPNVALEGGAELYFGDCKDVLSDFSDGCVDLIMTSPPYAERRKHTYGGVSADKYVEWFLPRSAQFLRVLNENGTFVLNIKEHAENGERNTYVLELILALRRQGWLWTEEFIWHKKNAYPGKWPNRFRDAWERLLQFNKQKHFNMYQDAVKVPIGDWVGNRMHKLSANDMKRTQPATGSGMGRNISRWVGKDTVLPDNVLHMAAECGNKQHSAVFPESLPEWFIHLFTRPGDCVLDPFMGSGTTVAVARRLARRAAGIDILSENVALAGNRVAKALLPLPKKKVV